MTVHSGEEITQVFRDSWNMYQKVVYLNHLNHRQIVEAFAKEIGTSASATNKKALRVLDIGVGDGWLPSKLLNLPGIPQIELFTGVDSTGEALDIAKKTAATTIPAINQIWQQADMSEYMKQCKSNTYDVIYSSYTIHHLDSSEDQGKPVLLQDIYRCLAPDSLFLWADVYNSVPGRSRDDMMHLWHAERFSKYDGLTEQEKTQIWDHVNEFDLPEELENMKKMLTHAGFVDVKVCYDDGFYSTVLCGYKK